MTKLNTLVDTYLYISRNIDPEILRYLKDKILNFAKTNNYNHLFVQIRGRGDAYYQSNLVPRSHLLKNTDFDPLDYRNFIFGIISKKNLARRKWHKFTLWEEEIIER